MEFKEIKDKLFDAWAEYKKTAHKRSFWLPDLSLFGVIRMATIAGATLLFFSYICRPAFINGGSMKPTYSTTGLNFCWKPAFWFKEPRRGQVVVAKYAGERIMLLKRIVALAGDTVEFKNGILLVNGVEQEEPYVKYREAWNLPERRVEKGNVYLVGDNRGMPINAHKFGQISTQRIIGVPLW
ncbi:MAG: signal peptidase I [Victivallales bacterium]|nr:signal peptidase I [Victivallales bacterium]